MRGLFGGPQQHQATPQVVFRFVDSAVARLCGARACCCSQWGVCCLFAALSSSTRLPCRLWLHCSAAVSVVVLAVVLKAACACAACLLPSQRHQATPQVTVAAFMLVVSVWFSCYYSQWGDMRGLFAGPQQHQATPQVIVADSSVCSAEVLLHCVSVVRGNAAGRWCGGCVALHVFFSRVAASSCIGNTCRWPW
jgi:hypothetical protein